MNWFDGSHISMNGTEIVSGFPAWLIIMTLVFLMGWKIGDILKALVRRAMGWRY